MQNLRTGLADATDRNLPRRFWLDINYQQAMINAEVALLESTVADLRSGALDGDPEDAAFRPNTTRPDTTRPDTAHSLTATTDRKKSSS